MFAIGDIVRIFAPGAGYEKYHLCIKLVDDDGAARFMFLNSNPNYNDTYAVTCDRVPCLPPSDTGYTAFSFNMLPIYNERQLGLYRATKLGELSSDVATELRTFLNKVEALTRKEMRMVEAALDAIIQRANPAAQVAVADAD